MCQSALDSLHGLDAHMVAALLRDLLINPLIQQSEAGERVNSNSVGVCLCVCAAVQSFTVGSCQLVFLLAGQLYLVAVSSRGEAPAALRRQLELLYQSILMVVTGGEDCIF